SKDEREFFTKEELINLFTLESVNKAPAVFDLEKLKWMNHKYILEKDSKELCEEVIQDIKTSYGISECNEKTVLMVDAVKGNINFIKDVKDLLAPFFEKKKIDKNSPEGKLLSDADVIKTFDYVLRNIENLEFEKTAVENFLESLREKIKLPSKKIYHPLRVALFYSKNGPELYKLFLILGKDEVKFRLKEALEFTKSSIQEQ
ncbi:MAG: glutamate--tRNA ligase, partial [Caldisericaceae bacterium]